MSKRIAAPEIERLIQLLARVPGLGPRSARRAALHLIKKKEALLVPLGGATDRRTLEVLLDVQRRLLTERGLIVTIRKTLCDASAHERGVCFQVQPLGPNGRALQSIDVLGVDAWIAFCDHVDLEQMNDPLYHAVGPTEGPLTPTDESFRDRVLARLLRDVGRSVVRPKASVPKALAS